MTVLLRDDGFLQDDGLLPVEDDFVAGTDW